MSKADKKAKRAQKAMRKWYLAEVRERLMLRGLKKRQAKKYIKESGLKDKVWELPDVPLPYEISVAVDEILASAPAQERKKIKDKRLQAILRLIYGYVEDAGKDSPENAKLAHLQAILEEMM